ncbi:MAG: hypothetical protein QW590_03165 [Candidatus Bilamarchaeaceae archaeon]
MTLEKELLSLMTKEKLEEAINEKIKNFHGFLTREVALKLLAAERGVLKREIKQIADIKPGARSISISGTVSSVYPVIRYKSGKCSRRIRISDSTGNVDLMLWNEDANEAASIKSGDEIEVRNAYEKNGTIRLGYSGYFKITKRAEFTPLAELENFKGKRIHVRSFISKIIGRTRSSFVFRVSDGQVEIECLLPSWDRRGAQLEEKREVIIENGFFDGERIQLDDSTRLLLRKKKIIVGIVRDIKETEEGIEVTMDEKKVVLNRELAYKFLDAKAAEDIKLATIISLKKDAILDHKRVIDLG